MGVEKLADAFLDALRPPPKLSLSDWSDNYAYLSPESSAESGRWKTLPYQKEMMDAITDPGIEQVTIMKSARVGYTKILNNVIGYYIHQDPCSMLLVQPSEADAEGYSKEEIAPMIRDTPVLQGIVSDAKAKDGSNTILQKMFPGGTLSLVGANAPRGFRRISRRVVMFDEVDGYPPSAGTEGDPIKLGIRRSEYFWNRKIVAGSTPLIKDTSRIEQLYEQSDQRRYYVPCPTCGEFQYLKWANLKWPEGEPEKAQFICESNGCEIPHEKKRAMIERGEWRSTAPFNGRHVGFHIWAAYSYSPNSSWGQLAIEFLEAKKSPETLQTFVNTVLGETWEESYSAKVGAEGLRARAETYDPTIIPAKVLALIGSVDVQDNRFAVSIYGYGRGEETWLISHQEIYGDPAKPEIWKQLDDVVLRSYRHDAGGEMSLSVVGLDTGGHFTHEVYAYVRERRSHAPKTHFLALKGSSQRGQPAIGKPSKKDINARGQTLKSGVALYMVGTDTIKSTIFARLKGNEPGPGFIHFHVDVPGDFFDQITSEKQVTRYVRGRPMREWVKKSGTRNEALDTLVYNYAGLQFLYTRYNRATIWDQFEKRQPAKANPTPAAEPIVNPPQQSGLQKSNQAPKLNPIGRKGFVSSW